MLLAEGILAGDTISLRLRRKWEAHMEYVHSGMHKEVIPPDSPRMLVRQDYFNFEDRLHVFKNRHVGLPTTTQYACGPMSGA